ncbi:DNA repair endonuclease XPF-like [Hydra vulgaris]|uniref:DNA repair endonuclease XPF n=1 Tax=Hydra vulgaris TaxID=6087 RepID=E5L9E3_HYDVU|nr:DNA repair endonuclease XPF-like [Hydra vulgaris]ADQ08682.1 xeroderma pigmentosum F DNA repair endonuclease [Hydra vulgaris]
MKDDGLLIIASGLDIDRILLKVIETFCKPENLVLVLNSFSEEQEFLIDELKSKGVSHLPNIITAEVTSQERNNLYLKGGVFFVTSRILVVDMLTKKIPIDYITGILVQRAHKVAETSHESFIMRMYRESNSDGFIKAFSDSPTSFLTEYCKVERVMKQLFLKKLYLRPRFHSDIATVFEESKIDVIEIGIVLTAYMKKIQLSLMELIEVSLKELKKSVEFLDTEDLTLENSLTNSFDKTLKIQLDPHWNKLNSKAKQLVADLKILRILLGYLTQYDCITFYKFLQSLSSNAQNKNSIWMFLDAANLVFQSAKARVYGCESSSSSLDSFEMSSVEVSPKWEALIEILNEIDNLNTSTDENKSDEKCRVLICAFDERTCYQLRQALCCGLRETMSQLYESTFPKKTSNTKKDKSKKKKSKLNNDILNNLDFETASSSYQKIDFLKESTIIIHPLSGSTDPYSLLRKLYELQPNYVVLYDAHIRFVRQLEIFKASMPEQPLHVYFLIYNGSVEEQRYLTNLRKEKESFELLIKQKAEMVVPEERDAKSSIAKSTLRQKPNELVTTRNAGGRENIQLNKKIIVDMREFRSELPSLIYKRGIDIVPVTLEVGDYILSPEMCVERKSITDLIGSLNNGRLYSQCLAMTRFYKKPILLIEFDEGKSFSLQGKKSLSNDVSFQNISSKLSLLIIHFPLLRIIWSQNPSLTAEIFEDLKSNTNEPDVDYAISVSADQTEPFNELLYNVVPLDVLQKFPGISFKNYKHVANKCKSLKDLINSSEDALVDIIGNSSYASKFYQFVNKEEDWESSLKKQTTSIKKTSK